MTRNGPYQYEVALSAADCSLGGTSVSSRSWRIFIDPWNKPKFILGKEKPRMSFSIVKSAFWLSLFPSATRSRDSWPANCRPTG
jgi:hypothetical protein